MVQHITPAARRVLELLVILGASAGGAHAGGGARGPSWSEIRHGILMMSHLTGQFQIFRYMDADSGYTDAERYHVTKDLVSAHSGWVVYRELSSYPDLTPPGVLLEFLNLWKELTTLERQIEADGEVTLQERVAYDHAYSRATSRLDALLSGLDPGSGPGTRPERPAETSLEGSRRVPCEWTPVPPTPGCTRAR